MVYLQWTPNVLQCHPWQGSPSMCWLHHTKLWDEMPHALEERSPGDKHQLNKKFYLFCNWPQGITTNKWDLCVLEYEGDISIDKVFMTHMKNYLGAVAKCACLGDQGIHWFCLKSKRDTCGLKTSSIDVSKSCTTSRRSIFIAVWKFQVTLSYVNKFSFHSKLLTKSNCQ